MSLVDGPELGAIIGDIKLDPLGRIILSEKQLEQIEGLAGHCTIAGGLNPKCSNSYCPGTTNGTCTNTPECTRSTNNTCYDSPIE
jgi:hypothetical protein